MIDLIHSGGFMPKAIVRFVLLMLIMFNHAVSACDNIVMHLPDEDHPFCCWITQSTLIFQRISIMRMRRYRTMPTPLKTIIPLMPMSPVTSRSFMLWLPALQCTRLMF